MEKKKIAGVALAVTLGLISTACAANTPSGLMVAQPVANITVQQPNTAQASAIESFGEKLFNQTMTNNVNAVVSPLSAYTALGMAYEGAAGSTAQAFQDVMGMTPDEARATLAYLLTTWQANQDGTVVTSANSAWLDKDLVVGQPWVDALKGYYQADVYHLDLQSADTVKQVNSWISDKTNKVIPSMLDRIDPGTVAMLVNALYLKAEWVQPFNTDKTHQGSFTTANGQPVDAWYMSDSFPEAKHFTTPTAEGVILPYKDGRLAFVAAMPTSGDLSLKAGDITSWLAAATTDQVIVTMPKFHTEFSVDMTKTLSDMGLSVAMTADADFSGIAPSLFISSVQQKVSMDVGEKGTVAAAATVVMMTTSGAINTSYVVFDQPYVYAIVDQVTGVPLFIGAMDDPSQAPPTVQ
ncbi:MAG: serpin family protein [Propionibacteriaceae bacterium]|nr:serpin family protein [Propionibacteriaceae bacterium]